MSPRIIHFTTVHPAQDIRIFVKECRTLAAAGYDVTLIAPAAPEDPIDGVRFVSLPLASGGRVRRAVTGNLRLLRMLLAMRGDVYHFHDPELLPLGVLLRAFGRAVVYDVHEDVVDDIRSKAYIPRAIRSLLVAPVWFLEWLMGRVATHVVAATDGVVRRVPASRTTIVHNYPLREELPSAGSDVSEYCDRALRGGYVGALTPPRQANEMFAAADALHARRPGFALVTAGPTFGIDDPGTHPGVDHRGTIARADVVRLLGECRFGVTLLRDLPHLAASLPTKFYEYAAAGLPVIVSRSNTPIVEIVEETNCGLVVDETSPAAIEQAMEWILDHPCGAHEMGQRGARAVRERFQWEAEAPRLLDVYRRITGGP